VSKPGQPTHGEGRRDDQAPAQLSADPAPPARTAGSARLTGGTAGTHWGFAAFFLGYGAYYLLSLAFTAVMAGEFEQFDDLSSPRLGPYLLVSFLPNVLLGVAPLVLSWRNGDGPRRDFGLLPTGRDLRVGLACGLGSLVAGSLLAIVVGRITDDRGSANSAMGDIAELLEAKTIWLAIFALFLFIGSPLTEELLVRGALWGALQHFQLPRYVILLLTALIFAFLHEEPWRTPMLFVAGLSMGLARMITGRVAASVVAHATNNFLPAVTLFLGMT
jgi:CAAX protease family protein